MQMRMSINVSSMAAKITVLGGDSLPWRRLSMGVFYYFCSWRSCFSLSYFTQTLIRTWLTIMFFHPGIRFDCGLEKTGSCFSKTSMPSSSMRKSVLSIDGSQSLLQSHRLRQQTGLVCKAYECRQIARWSGSRRLL